MHITQHSHAVCHASAARTAEIKDISWIDLFGYSEGAAETVVRWALAELSVRYKEGREAPRRATIVTGRSGSRSAKRTGDLHSVVGAVLAELGVPATASLNRGAFTLDLVQWRRSETGQVAEM